MPTDHSVRLVRGARTLTLTAGRYLVGRDFIPPDAEITPLLAAGTSANRAGGSTKIGERAGDRTWDFSVHIVNCASEREVTQAARDLRDFLAAAGDESEPLYLEYRATTDIAALPLWGQGVLRYEIIHGRFSLSELYATRDFRGRELPTCPVVVVVKPYALGQRQRLMSASGGVQMDLYGTSNGQPRGVLMAGSTANAFSNPLISNDGGVAWTAATCLLVAYQNDPAYALPFSPFESALLAARTSSSNTFTQNLTLANGSPYVLTALVKLPDSGTPASTDVQLVRGTTGSSGSFIHWGNGIWELSGSVSGTGAASPIGVQVQAGRSVYLVGMQTSPSRRMPFCHSALLGHSAASRANGMLRTAASGDVYRPGQGSYVWAWRSFYDSLFASNQYQFSLGASQLSCYYLASDDTFRLNDNSASIATAAQSYNTGCAFHFAATWGPSGLFLYINGAVAASTATYTIPAPASILRIGTDHNTANHATGTFMDFRAYGLQLTAAEIAADYANASPLLGDLQKIGDIPYLWTMNGNDALDNANDATFENWGVANGVPGTHDALTTLHIDTQSTTRSYLGLYLGNQRADYGRSIEDFGNINISDATADGDGNASLMDRVTATTVRTTQTLSDTDLFDGDYAFFVRAKGAEGASAFITPFFAYGTTDTAFPGLKITPSASYAYFHVGTGAVIQSPLRGNADIVAGITTCLASGSIALTNLTLMPRPLARIVSPCSLVFDFTVEGGKAINGNADSLFGTATVRGDAVELRPGVHNRLVIISGCSGEQLNKATQNTFREIYVTPRYGLL